MVLMSSGASISTREKYRSHSAFVSATTASNVLPPISLSRFARACSSEMSDTPICIPPLTFLTQRQPLKLGSG